LRKTLVFERESGALLRKTKEFRQMSWA